ncbi:hypothetical protein [Glutamicibacter arilaitensis]|uniref:hypothetical protein n=1 Tax=Glutamicibacter arilaitensis TaxID=256701 RepID=UPI003FCF8637
MTTDDLITNARRALETGQPNLAKLYMRNALERTDQQRRELNPAYAISKHLESFGEAVRKTAQAYLDAVQYVLKVIDEGEKQNDYALAGPAK